MQASSTSAWAQRHWGAGALRARCVTRVVCTRRCVARCVQSYVVSFSQQMDGWVVFPSTQLPSELVGVKIRGWVGVGERVQSLFEG